MDWAGVIVAGVAGAIGGAAGGLLGWILGALAGKSAVVEGAVNAETVTALARRLGVEMPISEAVHAIIRGRVNL